MKFYKNKLGSGVFKTDNYLKNLRVVEVNSVHDFLNVCDFDPRVLVGLKNLVVGRFDEIKAEDTDKNNAGYPGNADQHLESSRDDYFSFNWSDFNCGSYLDLLHEIAKAGAADDAFFNELANFYHDTALDTQWIGKDDFDENGRFVTTLTVNGDNRKLVASYDCDMDMVSVELYEEGKEVQKTEFV